MYSSCQQGARRLLVQKEEYLLVQKRDVLLLSKRTRPVVEQKPISLPTTGHVFLSNGKVGLLNQQENMLPCSRRRRRRRRRRNVVLLDKKPRLSAVQQISMHGTAKNLQETPARHPEGTQKGPRKSESNLGPKCNFSYALFSTKVMQTSAYL